MKSKNMIKLIAALLTLVMLFAACSSDDDDPTEAPETEPETTEAADPTEPPEGDDDDDDDADDAEPVELTFSWWGSDNRHEAIQEVIDLYTAQNPNVTINVEYGAWDDWTTRIMTQLAGGTEADIIQVNYNWVHSFGLGQNVFYDLNELSDYIDLSNWDQDYLDAMTVDGELAAVPHGMNGRVYLYNEALYSEYGIDTFPTTYDELLEAASLIAADNTATGADNQYAMMLIDPASRDLFIGQMLYDTTGKIMQENGTVSYTEEEVAYVFEKVLEFSEAGVIPSYVQEDPIDNESNPVWTSGRGGGIYEWANSMDKYLLSYKGGGFEDEIAVAPYITPDADTTPTIYVKPNLGYAISKNCANPEVAADFLEFFFTNEEAVIALGTSIGISSNTVTYAIQQSNDMLTDIMVEAYAMLDSYPQVVMDPYYEDANVRGERYTIYEAFRSGQMSVEEAAAEFIARQQEQLDALYS